MALLEAYDESVEVNGQTIISVLEGGGSVAKHAMEDEGLEDPHPDGWYSQQSWLNALKTINEKISGLALKNIGKEIPKNANWPPEIDDVETALASIDKAYHMNHRNGKIGHYSFEKTGQNKGRMVCDNPYPDEFDLGIIEATAKKFAEKSFKAKVSIDESEPKRSDGADSTTYLIQW